MFSSLQSSPSSSSSVARIHFFFLLGNKRNYYYTKFVKYQITTNVAYVYSNHNANSNIITGEILADYADTMEDCQTYMYPHSYKPSLYSHILWYHGNHLMWLGCIFLYIHIIKSIYYYVLVRTCHRGVYCLYTK